MGPRFPVNAKEATKFHWLGIAGGLAEVFYDLIFIVYLTSNWSYLDCELEKSLWKAPQLRTTSNSRAFGFGSDL